MPLKIANRRRQRRHSVSGDGDAWVEFEHPTPNGRHYRLRLIDVSPSGVSFLAPPGDSPAVETGASLPGATIQIGSCLIQGDLVIMHMTAESSEGPVCGALLYPATDADLLKLKSVVAGMKAVKP